MWSFTIPLEYQAEVGHHLLYMQVWHLDEHLATASFPLIPLPLSLCSCLGQTRINHFSKITRLSTIVPFLLIIVLFIQTFWAFLFQIKILLHYYFNFNDLLHPFPSYYFLILILYCSLRICKTASSLLGILIRFTSILTTCTRVLKWEEDYLSSCLEVPFTP